MTRRFWAFTLAETLIVMGIIGVVAALTVPNLNASTGEKEKVAKVKKIYKDLNDAYGRAVAVYGPVDEWFKTDDNNAVKQSTRFAERMLDFLKVSKICGQTFDVIDTECFKSLGTLSEPTIYQMAPAYSLITADSTSIGFSVFNITFTSNTAVSCPGPYCNTGIYIDVDIDTPQKGSRKYGKDGFSFIVDKDYGILPLGGMAQNITATDALLKTNCFQKGQCTGWVIENGNMDYLKVDSSGKCPNGTVLSWTNTTCK